MSIIGHRMLTDAELSLINEGKQLAEQVSEYLQKLDLLPDIDVRWLATGKTDLQKGFMSVTRSIARPTTF